MKKVLFYSLALALAATALSGCRVSPDSDEMDDEYVVFTSYDPEASFGAFNTYYIPDSILLITDSETPTYWKDSYAMSLIDEVVSDLNSRGYSRVDNKANATLGIQMSYIESTYFYAYYPDYWWWDYPGYWWPGYWGGWDGWYFPYAYGYAYTTNSLLIDALDLTSPQGATAELEVIWNAYITGFESNSTSYDIDRGVTAIDQSFTQSPYFTRN